MTIAVTGATGFIGQNLVRALLEKNYQILLIVRKDSNIDFISDSFLTSGRVKLYYVENRSISMTEVFKNNHVEGIIHLATYYLVEHKHEQIADMLTSNVVFSTQVLDSAVSAQVKWFVNTGTFWQHFKNSDYLPANLYAASKQAFEVISRFYIDSSSILFSTLKLNDSIGRSDKRKKLPYLLFQALQSQQELELSPGEQILNIVDVEDIVQAFLLMMKHLSNPSMHEVMQGKCFAVSSSEMVSLREFVEIFEDVAQKKINVSWGARPYRAREVMKPWSNYELVPGWRCHIKLHEAVARYLGSKDE